jgi:hypothetical protein
MKLVTFEIGDARHIGALLPDELATVDFTAADTAPCFRDMLALIDGGAAALDHARSLLETPRPPPASRFQTRGTASVFLAIVTSPHWSSGSVCCN